MEIPATILLAYGFEKNSTTIKPFGTGLINHTWLVVNAEKKYILQKINTSVFKNPEAIAANISSIADYLQKHQPDYVFVSPIPTIDGKQMAFSDEPDGGYYRVFPFVPDSHSKDVALTADSAYEAALQFGRFTRLLSGFNTDSLQITLPHFHDLGFRYQQFLTSLQNGNPERMNNASELIQYLQQQSTIVTTFIAIQNNPAFKKRVTHHDTKISNVLFNSKDKAVCVIDLDTLMPGYFISDVGDMMRTYLPTVNEEEADYSKIAIRTDMYRAIEKGYLEEMGEELSPEEKHAFFYAATFMIYMQAIRFLADYCNNDVYYGEHYPGQNLVRAGNQIVLLQKLLAKRAELVTSA